ncbi:MAG: nucleotidyltransferase domain-containing protein [Chlamydiae bacterium]|nr:nucleotidyltransferase domain-containing protein [Chlamydiota bacterium]MBI3265665.1 nucleotidyltransferase domain-containing protein [Chlamydiota bacterium]
MKSIVSKSVGIEASLTGIVQKIKGLVLAILYGSFAKGTERAHSDVDLLVVGNSLAEDRLLSQIAALEKKIQREINYKLYSEKEFSRRMREKDPFLQELLLSKHRVLKGDPHAF